MLYKHLLALFFVLFITYPVLGQDDDGDDDDALLASSTNMPADMDLTASFDGTESFDATDSGDSSLASTGNSGDSSGSGSGSSEDSLDDSDNSDDSGASSDGSNDDDDSSPESDDGTASASGSADDSLEDLCNDLDEDDCDDETTEEGDTLCAFNSAQGECYSVVRRAGVHGSGSFDDGFVAAKDAAKSENDKLLTVVGVLAGIIGALLIVLGAGGYYFYQRAEKDSMIRQTSEFVDAEQAMGHTEARHDDQAPMISQQ